MSSLKSTLYRHVSAGAVAASLAALTPSVVLAQTEIDLSSSVPAPITTPNDAGPNATFANRSLPDISGRYFTLSGLLFWTDQPAFGTAEYGSAFFRPGSLKALDISVLQGLLSDGETDPVIMAGDIDGPNGVGAACVVGAGADSLECGPSSNTDAATEATAVGDNSQATGNDSSAFGSFARATGTAATAVGRSTLASGLDSIAVGYSATASGTNSIAMGARADATGTGSVAIGGDTTDGDTDGAQATAYGAIAIGADTVASVQDTIAIGRGASATGDNGLSVGDAAATSGSRSTAIGANATAAGGASSTAIGAFASATGTQGVAVGQSSSASNQSVAVGDTANATVNAVAIGKSSAATGARSISLGENSSTTNNGAIALGTAALRRATDQFLSARMLWQAIQMP